MILFINIEYYSRSLGPWQVVWLQMINSNNKKN